MRELHHLGRKDFDLGKERLRKIVCIVLLSDEEAEEGIH